MHTSLLNFPHNGSGHHNNTKICETHEVKQSTIITCNWNASSCFHWYNFHLAIVINVLLQSRTFNFWLGGTSLIPPNTTSTRAFTHFPTFVGENTMFALLLSWPMDITINIQSSVDLNESCVNSKLKEIKNLFTFQM